jgi:hypothetical protein
MTDNFDPRQRRFPECRYFEDLAVGERFYIPSRTMTETHFAAFQTLSGDNHPIPLRCRILPQARPPGAAGAWLSNPVFHRRGGQQFRAWHQ